MAMKLVIFLLLLILQLLKEFHETMLTKEGDGGNFLEVTLEKSQILQFQFYKAATFVHFAIFFRSVVSSMYFIVIIIIGCKLFSKI